MRAFHNDPAVKAKYLERVRQHREADQLVKGVYWDLGKGCAVGCTIHSGRHKKYETELGIPEKLARLEDGIFEGLPNGKALAWPEQFLESIAVGADLSGIADRFLYWLLLDSENGVIRHAKTETVKKAIENVASLYGCRIAGEAVKASEWRAAAYAADAAAAAAAADAAADAAAADAAAADAAAAAAADAAAAAAAAADAAYDAAYAAAYAAAAVAVAAAARHKSRIAQSEKLVSLLAAAPVP